MKGESSLPFGWFQPAGASLSPGSKCSNCHPQRSLYCISRNPSHFILAPSAQQWQVSQKQVRTDIESGLALDRQALYDAGVIVKRGFCVKSALSIGKGSVGQESSIGRSSSIGYVLILIY